MPEKREHGEWDRILKRGRDIVLSYDTAVTLRQLFYRLFAEGLLPRARDYQQLSHRTTIGIELDEFPALADTTRIIVRRPSWSGLDAFAPDAVASYRRDRTKGQDVQLWIGVEKATLSAQVQSWFGALGIPVVVTRGFGSTAYKRQVVSRVNADGRPAVLLYVGDLDASGKDILRDFEAKTACWKHVEPVAVLADHVEAYRLIMQPGKVTDSRAPAFKVANPQFAHYDWPDLAPPRAWRGTLTAYRQAQRGLVQVEVEALDPNDLRALLTNAVDDWWDDEVHAAVLEQEAAERAELAALLGIDLDD